MNGYQSVLNSGLFSHFEQNTQDSTKRVYIRIKSHNELLLRRNTYRENFFLYNTSNKRTNEWYDAVRAYNINLQTMERDMQELIPVVINLIELERNRIIN